MTTPVEALRLLLRGTRWRKGTERFLTAEYAGYAESSAVADVHEDVLTAIVEAGLASTTAYALSQHLGIDRYPCDLTGENGLVGHLGTVRAGRVVLSSRSTISNQLKEANRSVMELVPERT